MGWARSWKVESGHAYRILVENPLRTWTLVRQEDNIKVDLWEVGCEDRRWMELILDRVRWRTLLLTVLNFGVLPLQCLLVLCDLPLPILCEIAAC
jgi:hypothetical protein